MLKVYDCHNYFQNGVSPIIVAAVSGSANVIPTLQGAGANVNSKDNVSLPCLLRSTNFSHTLI